MAMVAAISPGRMHAHNDLIPVQPLAQVLWKPRQIAFGQPFELLHHLPSLLYGVEAVHPKHDLNLHLQRQHAAKRFVSGVD